MKSIAKPSYQSWYRFMLYLLTWSASWVLVQVNNFQKVSLLFTPFIKRIWTKTPLSMLVLPFNNRWRWCCGRFNFSQRTVEIGHQRSLSIQFFFSKSKETFSRWLTCTPKRNWEKMVYSIYFLPWKGPHINIAYRKSPFPLTNENSCITTTQEKFMILYWKWN